jgi:hypothetical protein
MRTHPIRSDAAIVHEVSEPARYEIRIQGRLGDTLLSAFPTLHAEADAGDTVLQGVLPDEAALHGVLAQIEALGLVLLELHRDVRRYRPDRPRTHHAGGRESDNGRAHG